MGGGGGQKNCNFLSCQQMVPCSLTSSLCVVLLGASDYNRQEHITFTRILILINVTTILSFHIYIYMGTQTTQQAISGERGTSIHSARKH